MLSKQSQNLLRSESCFPVIAECVLVISQPLVFVNSGELSPRPADISSRRCAIVRAGGWVAVGGVEGCDTRECANCTGIINDLEDVW